MQLVICNNTRENFLWKQEEINVKLHKMTCLTNEIFRILPVFSQFLRNVKFYIFSHFHKELSLVLLQMTKWEWSESEYPEGVAGEKGGVGELVTKEWSEPSQAGLPLGSLCSLIHLYFLPFAPSTEPGPGLRPWRALWDKQPPMFEHLLLHRKSKQLYE